MREREREGVSAVLMVGFGPWLSKVGFGVQSSVGWELRFRAFCCGASRNSQKRSSPNLPKPSSQTLKLKLKPSNHASPKWEFPKIGGYLILRSL